MKRISTEAYQALRAALPAVTWYKSSFESMLKDALREHQELIVPLNFNETKREVSNQLINTLIAHEHRYQNVIIHLMLDVAGFTRFPDIERIKDSGDREQRLGEARTAVAYLKSVTAQYSKEAREREVLKSELAAKAERNALARQFTGGLAELLDDFRKIEAIEGKQERGYAFETFLNKMFHLHDMQPRISYTVGSEQIDGSFTFNTDDYILEARWRKKPADRGDADIFKSKVLTKGKNALGLFVSMAGFTETFKDRLSEGTPFITMDGFDLSMILEGRVKLEEALHAKRRHANDTGSCFLSVAAMM